MASEVAERAIVSSTIDLAHNLGLRAVAEGIEDLALLPELRALGCDVVQGYAISRPIPAAQATAGLLPRAGLGSARPVAPRRLNDGQVLRRAPNGRTSPALTIATIAFVRARLAHRHQTGSLADRDRDSALFVAPVAYHRASWAVGEGLNTLLLGERGQGKTSVLRQLALWLRHNRPDRSATFLDLAAARGRGRAAPARRSSRRGARAVARLDAAAPRPNETEPERSVRVSLEWLTALAPCTFFLDNIHAGEVGFPLFGVLRDRLWETPHHWVLSGVPGTGGGCSVRPPMHSGRRWSSCATALSRHVSSSSGGSRAARLWIAPLVESVGPTPRACRGRPWRLTREGARPDEVIDAWDTWNERVAKLDQRGERTRGGAIRPAVRCQRVDPDSSARWVGHEPRYLAASSSSSATGSSRAGASLRARVARGGCSPPPSPGVRDVADNGA